MKLVTFTSTSKANPTPGALINENEVVDLSALGHASVLAFIEAGPQALEDARADAAKLARLPLSGVKLLAPIQRPPRIFAIGLNYQKHADESNMPVQKVPTVFMKLSGSVVGP